MHLRNPRYSLSNSNLIVKRKIPEISLTLYYAKRSKQFYSNNRAVHTYLLKFIYSQYKYICTVDYFAYFNNLNSTLLCIRKIGHLRKRKLQLFLRVVNYESNVSFAKFKMADLISRTKKLKIVRFS